MERERKQEIVQFLQSELTSATNVFLVNFTGVNVEKDRALRTRLRDIESRYRVVKNNLVLRAIPGTPLEELAEHFSGPTAIAYTENHPVELARALTDFSEDHGVLEFKVGLVEGKLIDIDDIRHLATLPTREELLAQFVFMIQCPLQQFVAVLHGMVGKLVRVLAQIRLKMGDEASENL